MAQKLTAQPTSIKSKSIPVSPQTQHNVLPIRAFGPVVSSFKSNIFAFFRLHRLGGGIILLVTIAFFAPLLAQAGSYSNGGDAMFNAWTLARDHHCIMRQDCPSFDTANIFFPHKDTMLYSEAQLSTGLLTLPLSWLNDNPVFANNVWTVASFLFAGLFMYLLVRYLSKGKIFVAIVAGLIFEFAPFKMTGMDHLQNLSIFFLPLIILLLMKFFETHSKKYLVWLFVTLCLQFYASWNQMVFSGLTVGCFIVGYFIVRLVNWRQAVLALLILGLAALSTLPLATQYLHFSKTVGSTFGPADQLLYESSLVDYIIPTHNTLAGRLYEKAFLGGKTVSSYNIDSVSYHGLTLYALGLVVVISAYLYTRRGKYRSESKIIAIIALIGLIGFIMSLGPLLKIKGSYTYGIIGQNIPVTIVIPYALVDKFLPQLAFLRAIGRSSVLVLFSLCCLLAYIPLVVRNLGLTRQRTLQFNAIIVVLLLIELMPLGLVPMNNKAFAHNLTVPPVYEYIKQHSQINNIIILSADNDYPGAKIPTAMPEQVLWSGYTNRNIYNGYSGYIPPEYYLDYGSFKHFRSPDIPRMQKLGLQYVLVDKQLSTENPGLAQHVALLLPGGKIYEDKRYALFKLQVKSAL